VEPTGDITYVHVYLGTAIVVVSVAPDMRLAPDDPVWIGFDQQKLHLFDAATQQALAAV
jgi:multiple sugar transport system ATP-binding protein